jgi:magnesium transporter
MEARTEDHLRIHTFQNFIWTDICNPDRQSLDRIATQYNLDIHQITDSLERGHLPKIERLAEYQFIILRAFTSNIQEGATTINDLSNKIAFFINEVKLISVHQRDFPFLDQLKNDFTHPEDLLLLIINKMLDTYEPPLAELDRQIEELEKSVFLRKYAKVSLEDLYYLKTQTRITKKLLQLFQQVTIQLYVRDVNRSSLQDIRDRLVRHMLKYDEVLENAQNLLHTYHSVNAQKSNDVMKLLTVFSAFFLPLTFIAGIYGMNFEHMPELEWPNGYFITLGVMMVIALIIFIWFKRKRIL